MTTTVVNGEQGRKKIAAAETVRIHRGWLGSVAVSDGSQSMSDPLRTVLVRRPDASFGRAEKEAPILPNVEYAEARSNGWDFVTKKPGIDGVDAVLERFARQQYIADPSIGMAVYLSIRMGKPLLVEGEPGCGKTEIARTLAATLETELIRLQCYEGLDADAT